MKTTRLITMSRKSLSTMEVHVSKPKNNIEYETLSITMNDGEVIEYTKDKWDDYTVALSAPCPVAVVKQKGAWVGVFPLMGVKSIIMS